MKPISITNKTAKQVGEEHLAADGRQHVLASVRVPEAGDSAEKEGSEKSSFWSIDTHH